VLLLASGRPALADAKLKDLIKFYGKEAGTCQKNARGVRVVIERGRPVAGDDKELSSDLDELAKVQAIVQAHCDELESMVEFLTSDSSATYKGLHKDIEDRDTKIRASRAASRQALADSEQLISRSVPVINKLIAEADAAARPSKREQAAADKAAADKAAADKAAIDKAAADKAAADKLASQKTPVPRPVEAKELATFPSGRTVELPSPREAWALSGTADVDIADYAFAGAKASIVVRRHAGAPTCDQIRTAMTLVSARSAAARPAEPGAELKPIKPAWLVTWTEGDAQVRVACVAGKSGVVLGRTDVEVAGNAPLEAALARMIAAALRR
jgi:hypothetical protein